MSLDAYLNRIRKAPILSAEEERQLARSWKHDHDTAAGDRIVEAHLRLVVRVAFDLRGYRAPTEELIASGNEGLMKALKRFDLAHGVRFSTYALWWIRNEMYDYILANQSQVRLSLSVDRREVFFRLNRAMKALDIVPNGRELDTDEVSRVAKALDVKERAVTDIFRLFHMRDKSLDAAFADKDLTPHDVIASPDPSPEEIVMERQDNERRARSIESALAKLDPRERRIVRDRRLTAKPLTLEDLAQVLGVTRERIRQLEERGLEKMKKALRREGISRAI